MSWWNLPQISGILVYVLKREDVQAARDEFKALDCDSELADVPRLFALEVPGEIGFAPMAKLITEGVEQERWDYEIGVLRHRVLGSDPVL